MQIISRMTGSRGTLEFPMKQSRNSTRNGFRTHLNSKTRVFIPWTRHFVLLN